MNKELSSQEIEKLFNDQLSKWEQAYSNYEALKNVRVKELYFDEFVIKVQYNPARIQSSAAKVDAKSIQERKCFLCPANLPSVQEGLPFGEEYQVLVNPFPIFPKHFTIPTHEHVDQLILDRIGDMVDLAKCMEQYVLFYNGPKCGASAPDHAHFQAGNKGFLPIENDVKTVSRTVVLDDDFVQLYTLKDYYRSVFVIESGCKDKIVETFRKLYSFLDVADSEKEPMMNLLLWFDNGKWICCVFPREKHRPACYFKEDADNILISPASVDLGGVFITPLEKDFEKITIQNVKDIMTEITINDSKMQMIIQQLNNSLPKDT